MRRDPDFVVLSQLHRTRSVAYGQLGHRFTFPLQVSIDLCLGWYGKRGTERRIGNRRAMVTTWRPWLVLSRIANLRSAPIPELSWPRSASCWRSRPPTLPTLMVRRRAIPVWCKIIHLLGSLNIRVVSMTQFDVGLFLFMI